MPEAGQWARLCILFGLFLVPGLQAAEPEGYYDGIDAASSDGLRRSLHELIDDHQRFPYTSSNTDTWDILEMADQDPDEDRRIITVYRNISYPKRGGGNEQYNREHSWPKSYGFPDNGGSSLNYPYTDMHALFLADGNYNSERSNKPFEDCDDRCVEWVTENAGGRGGQGGGYPGDSNWTDGEFTQGRWEVWQGRRGDIARAMFYMDFRYEGGSHGVTGASEPDLGLTNDRALIDASRTDRNEPVAWMGLLDTLLAWHEEDPVDETERRHHEAVAAAQGNRNPFIDRPEWVACAYLEDCGLRLNAGLNDAWFDPLTIGQGFFVTVYPDIGKLFLSHFTYEVALPGENIESNLGAAEHRWLTALGDIDGDRAELSVTMTSGGLFDDPQAVQNQVDYGTYRIHFRNCDEAELEYELPAADRSGVIQLQRIVKDNKALCERLGSGVP